MSSDQIGALAAAQSRSFASRVRDHVAETFPESRHRSQPAEIDALIGEVSVWARRYDLGSEICIVKLIDLAIVLGSDWTQILQSHGRELLMDARLPRGDKLDELVFRVFEGHST